MRNIDKIIDNAILLDSEVSEYGRGKKSFYTAFMHKFYAPLIIDGKLFIAKMSVDESYVPNSNQTNKKFYHVRAIKIEPAVSVGIGNNHTPIIETTDSSISISDLFKFVKEFDENFRPKPVNPDFLNKNGTPKVFYHSTNEIWTEYNLGKNVNQMWGEGIYLTPNPNRARLYGDIVMPFYVKADTDYRTARRENREKDHLVMKKSGDVLVYSPNQIKSVDRNIGTFNRWKNDIRLQKAPDSAEVERLKAQVAKRDGRISQQSEVIDKLKTVVERGGAGTIPYLCVK